MVTVKDKVFAPFIEKTTLEQRIVEMGGEISRDYKGRNPLFVVVLNGAFMFASDLLKGVDVLCEISFIRLASYEQTQSTGKVKQILGLAETVQGREVIVIEDIVDTGLTMSELVSQLKAKGAASVEVVTLLHKPEALKTAIDLKYVGFEIENRFVVGYGLDYDGLGRNLDAIYVLAD
ncbi:hypoxanthine phosphoribosyltransferase [Telluribacter sp.]|jgi:hypoxanthine phosphoribosyltransferase|uniref:hypoxanthine phosphoribosyltransferase n=1 Tax=Telluribacter sp. TaxID=1978767 RepID=UPI002E0EF02E|nr:hypoxanthine phosphoribosyltransferase [Telluribacter sp.]